MFFNLKPSLSSIVCLLCPKFIAIENHYIQYLFVTGIMKKFITEITTHDQCYLLLKCVITTIINRVDIFRDK